VTVIVSLAYYWLNWLSCD